jgi:hypothetical protein
MPRDRKSTILAAVLTTVPVDVGEKNGSGSTLVSPSPRC